METEIIQSLSPFAKFHVALCSYKLFYKGKGIAKYVVWDKGFTNAQDILNGKIARITYKKKSGLGFVDVDYLPDTSPGIVAEINSILHGIPMLKRKSKK